MRKVVGPHQSAPVHLIGRTESHPVVLEGGVDVLGEVFARQLLELDARCEPVAVALVGMVHAIEVMRHPAGIGLDTHHSQGGMALEHTTENQRAHDVLIAADDRQEAVDARPAHGRTATRGQDVEGQRQVELDRRLPDRVIDRRVVILKRRIARHHHAAQPERLDRLEVLDHLGRRAAGGLSAAEQAGRMPTAEVRDPAVVGVKAGLLVVEVGVVAQQHAHRGIDDFGGHAVAVLIGHAGIRIPAATMQVAEFHTGLGDLLRSLAGGSDQTQVDRPLHAVDLEGVALSFDRDEARRLVAPGPVDMGEVGIGRLGDMRISRDDRVAHGVSCVWL